MRCVFRHLQIGHRSLALAAGTLRDVEKKNRARREGDWPDVSEGQCRQMLRNTDRFVQFFFFDTSEHADGERRESPI